MRIDIMTLFPETVGDMMNESILGRAQERDLIKIECHQIRDYTTNKQNQVDDYPYGGGHGAVLQADPLFRCWDHICKERFIEECVDEEMSLGDFVLTGGEYAAMAIADAVCRLCPGVLSDPECYENESHWDGMLEYPQYSRPDIWHGRKVPDILLSGHHANIAKWRRKMSIRRTRERRPDLYQKLDFSSKSDQKLLAELDAEDAEKK